MDAIYELITKIEYYSSFLDLLLCTFFCSAFMAASKTEKKQNGILCVGVAFVLAFVGTVIFVTQKESLQYSYQKSIFFFVLCVLIQWIYFRRKYFLAVVASLFFFELTMIIELVIEVALTNVSMLTYHERFTFLLCRISVVTIMVVLLHGLVPQTEIPFLYQLIAGICIVVSLLWNWALVGAEGVFDLPQEFSNIVLVLMFCIFFMFQVVVVFFVFKIAETNQQKQTTALIELNNKMLQKSLDETEQTFGLWRQSVHDYKNHVIVLKHLADENRLDEIKAFLDEENDTISRQLFMIRTGNSVVDTLVNLKRSLAEKHHIAFMVHGTLPEKMVVDDMDLANILGNLLDNAIEASMKEEEAYIDLAIKQEKNFFLLSIRNKCTDALEKEIDKSSKENPEFHGIGLKSVKRTIKKYDGQINIEQTPQEFIVNVMIQNTQGK